MITIKKKVNSGKFWYYYYYYSKKVNVKKKSSLYARILWLEERKSEKWNEMVNRIGR